MHRRLPLLVLALLPLMALAGPPRTVVLDVQNMTCPVCPITVRKALESVPGVAAAKVDLDRKTATVTFDPDKATPVALVKATTDAGYPSAVHK
jgi:mercuric ion binding protein